MHFIDGSGKVKGEEKFKGEDVEKEATIVTHIDP